MKQKRPIPPPTMRRHQSSEAIFWVFVKIDAIQKSAAPPSRRHTVIALAVIQCGTRALTTGILTPQNIVAMSMNRLPVMNCPAEGLPETEGILSFSMKIKHRRQP